MLTEYRKQIIIQEVMPRAFSCGYETGEVDFEQGKEYNESFPTLKEIKEMYNLADLGIDKNSEDMQEQIDFAYQVFCNKYAQGYDDGWNTAEKNQETEKRTGLPIWMTGSI